MAKPKNEGFPYCQQDTDTFQDARIRVLISKFGCDGYAVWDYIKQAAYREHGYYVIWDEDRKDLIASDLYITSKKTGMIVAYLLKRSLLISKSFNGITVLTSHGIQKRFQEMAKSAKRDYYNFIPEVWVLSEEETLRFIFCAQKNDNSGIKADNSGIKGDNSGIKAQKKRKEKNSTSVPSVLRACASAGAREREDFFTEFPKVRPDDTDVTDGRTDIFEGIDFEQLTKKFRDSKKLLQTRKSWTWVITHYQEILAGKYDDYPAAEKPAGAAAELPEAVKAANARADRESWYARRRAAAEAKAEAALERARKIPEYREIEKKLRVLEIELAKAELNAPDLVEKTIRTKEILTKDMDSVLSVEGIDRSSFLPDYSCKKCQDTGFLPDGRQCDCYEKAKEGQK